MALLPLYNCSKVMSSYIIAEAIKINKLGDKMMTIQINDIDKELFDIHNIKAEEV